MVDFQVAGTLRHLAAMLTGGLVALNRQSSLPAPVAAIIGMAACPATICRIVLAANMLGAALKRAVEVLVLLLFGRRHAEFLAAVHAVDHGSDKSPLVLKSRRATKTTEDMFALFSALLRLEMLAAVFAHKILDRSLRSHKTGMLAGAVNIISPEAIYAPTFDFDCFVTIGAGSINHVIATLDILLARMTFDVFMGGSLDDPTASALA